MVLLTSKPLHYAQFSCQTLYSTLSSAKAWEVLQLQNTDMRYKKRSIDKYFQWQIHNTVLKHNAPAQDEETARRHEGGLWHYSVTHCTHTAGIQRPVEALTVQLPVVSGWTPTYYVKYINSFGCSASVRLEECKNVGFATPVLDLCMCHCST